MNGHLSRKPVADASAWTGADLAGDRSWEVALDEAGRNDLLAALAGAKARGLPLALIDAASFPLPHCTSAIARIRHQVKDGRGFALLHGFPVAGQSLEDIQRMYWGFCAHLGTGVTQNGDGNLIHCVTEGRLRPNQGTRGVGNPGKVSLHVDLSDVVSLLCVRQAADAPPSRLASSMTVYNHVLERAPDQVDRLQRGFVWDRQNEHAPGETPTTGYRVPVFSEAGGVVSCRYNRNWITRGRRRDGGELSEEETRLFDLMDEVAEQTCLEFPFTPGDVQFANNYTTLHGRAGHAPASSEETTRLLMRIWLRVEGIRPVFDEPIVRHGVVSHGRLGWTGGDVAAGLEGLLHARRDTDAAPLGRAG